MMPRVNFASTEYMHVFMCKFIFFIYIYFFIKACIVGLKSLFLLFYDFFYFLKKLVLRNLPGYCFSICCLLYF